MMHPTDITSESLVSARQDDATVCVKPSTHVWSIDDSLFVKFLSRHDAYAYAENARITRALGFKAVDTHVVEISKDICTLYCPDWDDTDLNNAAALVMSRAAETSLEKFKKSQNKSERTETYSEIAPKLLVGGVIGMLPDLNDSNIFINNKREVTLIDFGEGPATLEHVPVAVQLEDFLSNPSRFPQFQVDLDGDELIAHSHQVVSDFKKAAREKGGEPLRQYEGLITKRATEFIDILKNS